MSSEGTMIGCLLVILAIFTLSLYFLTLLHMIIWSVICYKYSTHILRNGKLWLLDDKHRKQSLYKVFTTSSEASVKFFELNISVAYRWLEKRCIGYIFAYWYWISIVTEKAADTGIKTHGSILCGTRSQRATPWVYWQEVHSYVQ